jgi:hypothetical protein
MITFQEWQQQQNEANGLGFGSAYRHSPVGRVWATQIWAIIKRMSMFLFKS